MPASASSCAGFEDDLQPQSSLDHFHVAQFAIAAWRIRRAQVFESNLVRQTLELAEPSEAHLANPARAVTLAWADSRAGLTARYESTWHRDFRHHRAELRENELTRLCTRGPVRPRTKSINYDEIRRNTRRS